MRSMLFSGIKVFVIRVKLRNIIYLCNAKAQLSLLDYMEKSSRRYRLMLASRGWKRFLKARKRKGKLHLLTVPITPPLKIKKNRPRKREVVCPAIFSVSHNLQGVLEFCAEVHSYANTYCKTLHIKMDGVIELDVPALVMLLSNINQIVQQGINVQGNYPSDDSTRSFFKSSGFLNHMDMLNSRGLGTSSEHNLIINVGGSKYDSISVAQVNKDAVEIVGGTNSLYQKMNGMVGEMAGNTIKYAYSSNKHYLYGCSKMDDGITFVFADSGYGILKTLKKKFFREIEDKLKTADSSDVLLRAFHKKYGSNTGEDNRNRGLPFIKSVHEEGYISELTVIANTAKLKFGENVDKQVLECNYSGTVYMWKILKQR